MGFILPFLHSLLLSSTVSNFNATDLRVFFSSSPDCKPGLDCFRQIPRNADEAAAAGWVIPSETANEKLFTTYCPENNNRICMLADRKGSIAGMSISIPTLVDTLEMPDIDYLSKGFIKQTLLGEEVYSNQIFFVPQKTLKTGRRYNGQIGTGLYLPTQNGLFEVPLHESEMSETLFKKQNCMPRMGQHYFWNNTRELQPKDFLPWFTLHNVDGDLHGFGFIAHGSKVDPLFQPTFEDVPNAAIQFIAPSTPDWIFDYSKKYGLYSLHVYFASNPWNIPCGTETQAKY